MQRALTGIQPSGDIHLGNYLGMIKPALDLQRSYQAFYFIADYHALTTTRDPSTLRRASREIAATFLAFGLDVENHVLFRQSDVVEVTELAWILSCHVSIGQLDRGHAVKAAKEGGREPNAGTLYYPVLMAADILLYDTNVVPVGRDQKQHLELCRDVAIRFNHIFGEDTLVVPEAVISEGPAVPGLDGEKMSKSRGNTVPLFAPSKKLRKTIMKITTGSEPLEAKKVAAGTTIFELFKQVAPDDAPTLEAKLAEGGYGWGHAKQDLYEAVEEEIGPKREAYLEIRANEDRLDALLHAGAGKAREIADRTMGRVRQAVGIE